MSMMESGGIKGAFLGVGYLWLNERPQLQIS